MFLSSCHRVNRFTWRQQEGKCKIIIENVSPFYRSKEETCRDYQSLFLCNTESIISKWIIKNQPTNKSVLWCSSRPTQCVFCCELKQRKNQTHFMTCHYWIIRLGSIFVFFNPWLHEAHFYFLFVLAVVGFGCDGRSLTPVSVLWRIWNTGGRAECRMLPEGVCVCVFYLFN